MKMKVALKTEEPVHTNAGLSLKNLGALCTYRSLLLFSVYILCLPCIEVVYSCFETLDGVKVRNICSKQV